MIDTRARQLDRINLTCTLFLIFVFLDISNP